MKLPEIAIKNRQFVFVLIAVLVFIGFRSYKYMPKSEDPSLNLPIYTVIAIYPGATPDDMENQVVEPIEDAIDELDEITEIRTKITDGLAILKIESEFNKDYDEKYNEIQSKVNNLRGELPEGLYDLEVNQYKPEDQVIIQQFAFHSDSVDYDLLRDQAEKFQEEIDKIEQVKKTSIEAAPKEEIQLIVDHLKLAELGIPLRQLLGVLKSNNVEIPGGSIEADGLAFNIKTSGSFKSFEDVSEVVIKSVNGSNIKVKDIAKIKKGYEKQLWKARYNQHKAIYLTVNQKSNSNILDLKKRLDEKYNEFKKELPPSVNLDVAFEQASAVDNRISDFISNLLQGILFVGVIISLFMGWKPSLIVMMVIPLSILIAIVLLDFTGFAIQQISIAALVIALGLLVDNAIVVIENIVLFRNEGHSIGKAASMATAEVGYAIISSTITTILAFAPLALLSSGPGEYLRSLPLTVIFTLLGSLLLALTVTPIVAKSIHKRKKNKPPRQLWLTKQLQNVIKRVYRPSLAFALKRGWIMIIAGVGLLVFSITLFPSIGVSFFPTADKSLLLISVDLPYNAGLEKTDKAVKYVENVLDTAEYVESYTVNIGHGNPQVYYNRVPENYKKYHGEVLVNFKKWNPEKFYQTLSGFNKAFSKYSDARINFRELKNGSPFEAPVEIILKGESLDTLKSIAQDIETIFLETNGTKDVNNPMRRPKTDLKFAMQYEKIADYGLDVINVDRSIRAGYEGVKIGDMKLDQENETFPLLVKLGDNSGNKLNDLQGVSLVNNKGMSIPMKQITTKELSPQFAQINHYNTERAISVTSNVINPDNTKEVTEDIISKLENYSWPDGYDYKVGGEYEAQQQSFGSLGILLMLALMGIFAVLVVQFKSIIQPLIIFSAIPLAITGSFIALYITGWSFSFFAFVGFISLVGIVVNNSIILVDYTNLLIKNGEEKKEAIKKAAERRFTPIVLTTLTTIIGLMPLTFSGTSLWSPLGWTLIGGLLSSMLLTLIIVPILYNWLTRSKKIKNLKEAQ